jgi:upstream activation factor subunit UAF30
MAKAKAKKAAAKKPAKKAAAKKPAKKGRGGSANAAFMKPMKPSDALAAVVGSGNMPRTEVTKKVWQYIKKHGLQDAKEKRNINADENLKKVFGGKAKVNMFEMTKLVNKHLS